MMFSGEVVTGGLAEGLTRVLTRAQLTQAGLVDELTAGVVC